MIIASAIIAIIVCDPVVNEETSDGYTHTKPVSCVLYNHLYKVVIVYFVYFIIDIQIMKQCSATGLPRDDVKESYFLD